MERIPILKMGNFLLVTIQVDMHDQLAMTLQEDLTSRIEKTGAKGVLIGRPVMWGLAAYGAEGVQGVVEMLQTELARYMCMCGRPSLAAVDASLVRVHAPRPTAGRDHG